MRTQSPILRACSTYLCVTALFILGCDAQFDYTIDLAENPGGMMETTIQTSDEIRILIKNRIPGKAYDVVCVKSVEEVDPFPFDAFQGGGAAAILGACPTYQQLITDLSSAVDEVQLKGQVDQYRADIASGAVACNAEEARNVGSHLTQLTEMRVPIGYRIRIGERLTISISRKDPNGDVITWKHVLSAGSKGRWFVTYGFSFIPDAFNVQDEFFAKAQDSSFVVAKQRGNNDLRFVPSIMMHWQPRKWAGYSIVPSISGGLGFDIGSPTVFLGGSVIYKSNLGLHLGIAFHEQTRPNGKYQEGQILLEKLDDEQLNTEAYTINPFVSISFRFNTNPFKAPAETE